MEYDTVTHCEDVCAYVCVYVCVHQSVTDMRARIPELLRVAESVRKRKYANPSDVDKSFRGKLKYPSAESRTLALELSNISHEMTCFDLVTSTPGGAKLLAQSNRLQSKFHSTTIVCGRMEFRFADLDSSHRRLYYSFSIAQR